MPLQRVARRAVSLLLTIVLAVYIAMFLFALLLADRVLFQPHVAGYRDSAQILKLPTRDGQSISAMYMPNPQARFTILFSHGNAEDLGDLAPLLNDLKSAGFAVFAYDYRGYGTSQGKPSEANLYADADAAYDYLTGKLGVPPRSILDYGRSLGGAVAVDLASRRPVAGLIVQSSFVSAFRVLTRVPLLPWDRFRSADKLKQVRCPVLVMHGRRDEVIPFINGEKLFKTAGEPKRSLWLDGAGHNDVAEVGGPKYVRALREFAELVEKSATAADAK